MSEGPRRTCPEPIRIGIDGGLACSSRPTGVEWFARSLLAELVLLPAPQVQWHLYLPPKADPGFGIPPQVRVRYRPDVNTLIKTPWLIAQTWRDRVAVSYAFGHLLPLGCAGNAVVTVHDLAFDEFPECYAEGVPAKAHAEVAAVCPRAARIVVPSRATREGLVSRYGYPAERTDVILEGSRPNFKAGEPGPLPERVMAAGIVPPFFLCVGRLDRRKNIVRVIEAYRSLLSEGTPCGGLVIAGPDDSGTASVRERISAGQVDGERICVTGYVGEDELVSLYRNAAALVYPSLAEGFGLPVLEGMSCGTPVVTSNLSSMPEVAGDACLLVEPHEPGQIAAAMRRVLDEPGLAQRLRAAGLRRSAELTWRGSAERLLGALLRAGGRDG